MQTVTIDDIDTQEGNPIDIENEMDDLGKEEQKSRFIHLRAKGNSFDKIAKELKVSKSTLSNWSQELEEQIAQTKAMELEALQEEFFLQYQLPVLAKFGLVAFGCCEDLTCKIDMLRKIPNLRRIAVAPFADAARCAKQIGQDYVLSYRPSPADMVSYGFDRDRIRSILRRELEACKDTHVDITLKDVETVQADPARVQNWVQVTREVIDEIF